MNTPEDLELKLSGRTVLLRLRIRPGGRRNQIIGVHGGALKCQVTAAPERGKANHAVLRLLTHSLNLPKGSIEIVAGTTSHDKTVSIENLDITEIRFRVAQAIEASTSSNARRSTSGR